MNRIVLAAALLAAGLVGGCGVDPQVTFDSMCIHRLGLDATEYKATLRVNNPNATPLTIEEIRWALTSGQDLIADGSEARTTELPAGKVSLVVVHVLVPHAALVGAGLADHRRFDYDLAGQIRFSGHGGDGAVAFADAGAMPIIQELQARLQAIDRVDATDSRVGIVLTVNVSNPNDIGMVPSRLEGDIEINGRAIIAVDTVLDGSVCVPPNGSAELRIPMWVSSPQHGVRSLDALLTTPGTRVRLVGRITHNMPGSGDVSDVLLLPSSQPEQDVYPSSDDTAHRKHAPIKSPATER